MNTIDVSNYINIGKELASTLVYNMDKRGIGNYTDCSNFIARTLIKAGINVNPYMNTSTMPKDLPKVGFKQYNFSGNLEDLKEGDILYIPRMNGKPGHTAFYLGDSKTLEARNSRKVVGIFNYYRGMATAYFRKIEVKE